MFCTVIASSQGYVLTRVRQDEAAGQVLKVLSGGHWSLTAPINPSLRTAVCAASHACRAGRDTHALEHQPRSGTITGDTPAPDPPIGATGWQPIAPDGDAPEGLS